MSLNPHINDMICPNINCRDGTANSSEREATIDELMFKYEQEKRSMIRTIKDLEFCKIALELDKEDLLAEKRDLCSRLRALEIEMQSRYQQPAQLDKSSQTNCQLLDQTTQTLIQVLDQAEQCKMELLPTTDMCVQVGPPPTQDQASQMQLDLPFETIDVAIQVDTTSTSGSGDEKQDKSSQCQFLENKYQHLPIPEVNDKSIQAELRSTSEDQASQVTTSELAEQSIEGAVQALSFSPLLCSTRIPREQVPRCHPRRPQSGSGPWSSIQRRWKQKPRQRQSSRSATYIHQPFFQHDIRETTWHTRVNEWSWTPPAKFGNSCKKTYYQDILRSVTNWFKSLEDVTQSLQ